MSLMQSTVLDNHRSLKKGFTLIELLVVISIVALLISILLPALRKSRDAARDMQCLTQVRQFGMALVQYSHEYNGYMPPYRDTYMDKGNCYWPVYLSEFLGKRVENNGRTSKMFLCPRDPAPFGLNSGVFGTEPNFNFGYTNTGSYGGEASFMPYNSGLGAKDTTRIGRYRFDQRVHGGMVMITDAPKLTIDLRFKTGGGFPNITWHSNENVNGLRGDLSASAFSADQLVDLAARYRP